LGILLAQAQQQLIKLRVGGGWDWTFQDSLNLAFNLWVKSHMVVSYYPQWVTKNRRGDSMSKIGLLAKKITGLLRGLLMGLALVGLGGTAHAQATQAFGM